MNNTELAKVIALGEDSRHQFKRDATNADGLAAVAVQQTDDLLVDKPAQHHLPTAAGAGCFWASMTTAALRGWTPPMFVG